MDPAISRPRWRVPAAVLAAAALALTPVPSAAGTTAVTTASLTTAPTTAPAADADREASVHSAVGTTAVRAPVTPDLAGVAVGGQAPRAAAATAEQSAPSAEAAEAAVTEYWTAERMATALPADGPEGTDPGAAAPGASGDAAPAPAPHTAPGTLPQQTPQSASDEAPEDPDAPTVIAEPIPAADADQDPQATPVLDYSHTNGKVFFRDQTDGRDYVCSGSAVNSPAARLVITAGHCVHGGPGGTWHANWVFAPGYDRGPGPEGTFPATSFRALDDWIDYGASARGFHSDVALVTTADNDEGETVVEAVGGHGLATGGTREFEASLFGYPTNRDSGERMWACHGRTGTQEVEVFRFPSITGCGFGPGSSGGPWLYRYDDGTGLGLVRSVTSFGPAVGNAYVSGPYFDERVADLYEAADGDGSP